MNEDAGIPQGGAPVVHVSRPLQHRVRGKEEFVNDPRLAQSSPVGLGNLRAPVPLTGWTVAW